MNNIIKRVWNQNRMVNIEDLSGMAFQAEDGGHTFEISGVNDAGETVELSGTVSGVFMRPDLADIAIVGSATDGVVSVTLPADCYAVNGRFALTIFVTSDSQKVAVYAAVGTVTRTSGGAVAGDTPQDVVDLINAINAAVASIPADYTDLMAAVAQTYSNTALYAVGSYAWYNGNLYRCVSAITTAEAWTAAHWAAAVLGDDVADLKSAINIIGSVSYTEYDGYIGGSGSIENPSASSQEKYTNKLSVSEGDVLEITLDYPSTVGIWVAYATYDGSGAFIGRYVIGNTNNTHFSGAVTIPSGVAFIVFTYRTWGNATRRITFLTDTYELGKSAIELKKITEPSNNLFGGAYSGFGNMALSDGKLTNTVADTYPCFYFTVQFRNNSTNVNVSNTIPVNFTGRVRLTVTTSGSGNNITILHNGLSKNFVAIIPFNFVSGKTYTLSLNVEDYHVQEIGGLVLSDVQIEEGNANTPYIPAVSGIDYVAREIVNSNITERGLNVLLMGDSIFGNDGEIALFLDEMFNSCTNGAFGGTRVTVRSDSSDGFRYFDGINIITALCTQTWTNQDTAAASLSSTYPWITARLTGLKNVDMSKIDLLIMDWGTNDYTAGATIEDITTAYNTVIDLLQTTYPKLRILITTPIWRYWGTEADNENGDNKVYNVSTLKEIALAIEDFMKNKRISVLNAYQNLPLSYKTALTYFDANDKTHLNTFGNKVYAYLLHGKIRSIY